jgi:hypothetical protein
MNKLLIRISPALFSDQVFMVCSPFPSLELLLARPTVVEKRSLKACNIKSNGIFGHKKTVALTKFAIFA